MPSREPTLELGAYGTTLDDYKPVADTGDLDVKTDLGMTSEEVAECTLGDVLRHRKTKQMVRLFDKHIRTGSDPYSGPEVTVETLQESDEHHAAFLDFVHWLPLSQSAATAQRVQRIAIGSLKRLQQINALKKHAERVATNGARASV